MHFSIQNSHKWKMIILFVKFTADWKNQTHGKRPLVQKAIQKLDWWNIQLQAYKGAVIGCGQNNYERFLLSVWIFSCNRIGQMVWWRKMAANSSTHYSIGIRQCENYWSTFNITIIHNILLFLRLKKKSKIIKTSQKIWSSVCAMKFKRSKTPKEWNGLTFSCEQNAAFHEL